MASPFRRNAGNQQSQSNDQSWKADGFLNFYLPRKDGAKRKLGTISLHLSKENEAMLIEWLKADENNIHKLKDKLQLEFNTAELKADAAFDLD